MTGVIISVALAIDKVRSCTAVPPSVWTSIVILGGRILTLEIGTSMMIGMSHNMLHVY